MPHRNTSRTVVAIATLCVCALVAGLLSQPGCQPTQQEIDSAWAETAQPLAADVTTRLESYLAAEPDAAVSVQLQVFNEALKFTDPVATEAAWPAVKAALEQFYASDLMYAGDLGERAKLVQLRNLEILTDLIEQGVKEHRSP